MATKSNTKAATRTATVAATANPLTAYADRLKAWPTQYAGPKPTAENFTTAHALGARPGSTVALAIAMYLRAGGATQGQVFNGTGKGPQLNKARQLVEAGHAVRVAMPASATGHLVYKLALPAKAASKAAKGKGKGKAASKAASKGKAASKAATA